MMETIEIAGHKYRIEGATLVAETYADGVELHICNVTNDLSHPVRGVFVRRGPRGGLRPAYGGFTRDEATEVSMRLVDMRQHIDRVEAFRQTKWGGEE